MLSRSKNITTTFGLQLDFPNTESFTPPPATWSQKSFAL